MNAAGGRAAIGRRRRGNPCPTGAIPTTPWRLSRGRRPSCLYRSGRNIRICGSTPMSWRSFAGKDGAIRPGLTPFRRSYVDHVTVTCRANRPVPVRLRPEARPLKPQLPRRPAGEGLSESDDASVIGSLDERLVDRVRIIGRNRAQRDFRLDSAARSPNKEASDDRVLRRTPRPRAAGARGEIDPVDLDLENRRASARPARDEAPRRRGKPARAPGHPRGGRFAGERRSGPTLTTMARNLRPLWARALEAAPVNERPNAPRAASASRRVMALATIVILLLPATVRPGVNRSSRNDGRRD